MYETGVRISEAQALQRDAVNMDSGTIEVRRSYSRITKKIESTTKSKKKRIVVVTSEVRQILLGLFNQRRSEFVFAKEEP